MIPTEQIEQWLEEEKRATPKEWSVDHTIVHEKSYSINGVSTDHEPGVATHHNHGSRSWTKYVCVPAHGHSCDHDSDSAKNMQLIVTMRNNWRRVLEENLGLKLVVEYWRSKCLLAEQQLLEAQKYDF